MANLQRQKKTNCFQTGVFYHIHCNLNIHWLARKRAGFKGCISLREWRGRSTIFEKVFFRIQFSSGSYISSNDQTFCSLFVLYPS